MSKLHKVSRTVQRRQSERTNNQKTLDNMMDYWKGQISRGLALHANIAARPLKRYEDSWLLTFDLEITREDKSSGKINEIQLDKQIDYICALPRWNKYPWVRCTPETEGTAWINPDNIEDVAEDAAPNYEGIFDFDVALKWEDFDASSWEHLISAPDEEIESHPNFAGIYDMAPHIRLALGTIKRAIDTGGAVRNHTLLWGDAGCGKTSTLEAILGLLPNNAYIKIHADSATNAGFRKVFFRELSQVGVPPIFTLEECDKVVNDHDLAPFLSIFDRRGKIQQLNARMAGSMNAPVLGFLTVNNKTKFDNFLAGALSSRCTNQLYVPRPSDNVLRRILRREIDEFGGNIKWVDPIIELAKLLDEHDPRVITGHLAGGNRLLDGTYQRDILATRMATSRLAEIRDEENDGGINIQKQREYDLAMKNLRRNGFKD